MCKKLTPLIQETREGCLYHAFRDDQDKASTACERVVQQPKPSIYAIDDHKWLYVLPTEETFSLQCTGQPNHQKGSDSTAPACSPCPQGARPWGIAT
ncbi:hypothetical protein FJT64_024476 [Amphibalanus amphitrite]|uniref:Uncharacterized protein n=1 Tax=Amphibalanus amphitrite TaxID=1232801 RepID=A0A6A4WIU7_AMPAM|nr:hypothetical protein FJT64_024476 [Amphibalanus amphitrite]